MNRTTHAFAALGANRIMKRITIALTSTNVLKRLAPVEKVLLTREPWTPRMPTRRGAVRRMVMRPQEGRLDILWHHADEPRAVSIGTTMRIEKNTEEAAPTRSTRA